MSGIRIKRRIVAILVIALIAWPPVHHVLVRTLDLSPWKGFAWSMYCEPMKRIRITAVSLPVGRPLPRAGANWPVELRFAYNRFGGMRQVLRRRAGPEPYARALFAAYPGVDEVEITVEQFGIDRATARLALDHRDRYVVRRNELAAR